VIVQIKHVHDAIPIRFAFSLAMDPDGFDECALCAMLRFDEAFELVCVGFVHLETFLVRVQFVRSTKRHKR
jgi:hypothetical protein